MTPPPGCAVERATLKLSGKNVYMSILEQFNPGRVPAERLLRRGSRSCYAIMHFGLNTFSGKEWGYGDEDPAIFTPAAFDAEQIVRACRDGGLSGIILVCKHHDGFCLWPTKTTPYNITRSPFRGGRGDLVREVAAACRKYGLEMGFYVSPWDRNHPDYGTPAYLKVYQAQLREIYSGYGPAFEAWFDGANGGDGFYGGARETRRIDASTYYDWGSTWKIVRDLQPDAVIFSDIGPDVRWPGNENGLAGKEAFGSYTPHAPVAGREPAPGFACCAEGENGHADGRFFIPPECDVPLRPGWFYHPEEDELLRSVPALAKIYLRSVGCGGFLNLGIAPDRRGVLHENDVRRLREFREMVEALNGEDVVSAALSLSAGEEAVVEFGAKRAFNLIDMAEDLSAGESVTGYTIEVRIGGVWREIVSGKAVGLRRMKLLPEIAGDALRFRLTSAVTGAARLTLACRPVPAELLNPGAEGAGLPDRENYLELPPGEKRGMALEWLFAQPISSHGFLYTPVPGRWAGTPDKYRFELLIDGQWRTVAEGEFANLRANPIPQRVLFAKCAASGCRLTATRCLEPGDEPVCGAFGLLID